MYRKGDISEGIVGERIIRSLLDNCSVQAIMRLYADGFIINEKKNPYNLTCSHLYARYLSVYSEASGVSVRYFFFGSDDQPQTSYTSDDALVIEILDNLDEATLAKAIRFAEAFFPSELYEDGQKEPKPSQNILRRISAMPHGVISVLDEQKPEVSISEDLRNELARYRRCAQSRAFSFDSNLWYELSAFTKVSLHWVLNLQCPLFCQTQLGDILFDRYTLMGTEARKDFLDYLTALPRLGSQQKICASSHAVTKFAENASGTVPNQVAVPRFSDVLKAASEIPDEQRNPNSVYAQYQKMCADGQTRFFDWFGKHKKEVTAAIEERMQEACANGSPQALTEQEAFYLSASTFPPCKITRRTIASPLLSQVAYHGRVYADQSSHKIIFGESKDVVLFGRANAFLEAISSLINTLSFQQIAEVTQYLERNALKTNNVSLILKERSREIADKLGVAREKFFARLGGHAFQEQRKALYSFTQNEPLTILDPETAPFDFQCSPAALRVIIFISVKYGLPIDYLLLQDYSGFAVYNNRPLSDYESKVLSIYLQATSEAQRMAIKYIGLVLQGLNPSLPEQEPLPLPEQESLWPT